MLQPKSKCLDFRDIKMDRDGSSGVYLQLTCRHVQVPCAHPLGFQALLLHRWCGPLWQQALWIITCRNQRCNDGAVDGGCVPDTCNLKNTKNTGKGDQWSLCFGNDFRRYHGSFWQFVTPLWPFFSVNPPLNHSSVSSKNNTSSQIHPGFNPTTHLPFRDLFWIQKATSSNQRQVFVPQPSGGSGMDPGQRLCLEVTYDSLYRTVRPIRFLGG